MIGATRTNFRTNDPAVLAKLKEALCADATEAEFWFKSAEDAEAAGFVRAGGPKEDDK